MPRLWTTPGRGVRDPLGKHEQVRTGGSVTIRQTTEETPMYTSEVDVYANSEGEVVPADSPDAAILVVAAGGTITDEEAAKYGLTDDSTAPSEGEEGTASSLADRPAAAEEVEDKGHAPGGPSGPATPKPTKK